MSKKCIETSYSQSYPHYPQVISVKKIVFIIQWKYFFIFLQNSTNNLLNKLNDCDISKINEICCVIKEKRYELLY